ncbi:MULTISPECIES: hypothetical protein [unclassified Janthinobacterium]|uniref:hypothetical protein n=1 Tax=unclassified Janthinobacterium TaxID=2610881 RepID=UPI00034B8343|nr:MULTISPECIES: hypothetical protein [unclassified Janthinobacterium]MEC5163380.1 hypothetical protein [Janthinobacterium sp. CG_S6]
MTAPDFAAALLGARLRLRRLGALAGGVAALCLLGVAASGWAWQQRAALARLDAAAVARATAVRAAPPALALAPVPASAKQNLALFYDNLGQRRYAEQQVGTLFALAAKAGLTLSHGEYKFAYERASGVHTYQVLLPVKGPYRAIWQFCLQLLLTVPFASLDEINFKRELIADPAPEARLRLTFYLKDTDAAVAP